MPTETTFRVDKFVVPEPARREFWTHVLRTHRVLAKQPGFVADELLEQVDGSGRFNVVTSVKWESADAMAAARPVVLAAHAKASFDPQTFFAREGIEADLGGYRPVDRSMA